MESNSLKPTLYNSESIVIPPIVAKYELRMLPIGEFPKELVIAKSEQAPNSFRSAVNAKCPLCDGTKISPVPWNFDGSEQRLTISLDPFATALANTVAHTMAALLGKKELETDLGSATIELYRLFLSATMMIDGAAVSVIKHKKGAGWQPLNQTVDPPGESTPIDGASKAMSQHMAIPQNDEELEGFYGEADGKTYSDE